VKKKILYAGDSPAGGPANYLLAILKDLKVPFKHIPPSQILKAGNFDAIILSDFSRKNLPAASEKKICEQVRQGSGLLMVGGWGSFSGPFGGWRGSMIETLLPVRCLRHDDRLNFPGGALIKKRSQNTIFDSLSFSNPPVICGMNRIQVKPNGRVILSARKIAGGTEYPLFIIDSNPEKRVAALTTDLAPHWCGGMVDWGSKHRVLPVNKKIRVEIGTTYVDFVQSILKWLIRA
jgi:uncharacterized membrane protein